MTGASPAVASVWNRHGDAAATITVTGVVTMHGVLNVEYDYDKPDVAGAGISELSHFLAHHTEANR